MSASEKTETPSVQQLEEQIQRLNEQIEQLEESAEESDQDSADLIHAASRDLSRALQRLRSVEDLVQYCTLRNQPMTVAAVELALQGRCLGVCLTELESVGA